MIAERELVILEVFAEWGSSCRAKYTQLIEPPDTKSHGDQIREDANKAFLALESTNVGQGFDRYAELENAFHKAAAEYFYLELHRSDYPDPNAIFFREYHEAVWRGAVEQLQSCTSREALRNSLEERYGLGSIVDRFPQRPREGFDSYRSRLSQLIEKERDREFQSRLSESAIFEKLGRQYAIQYFEQKNRRRGAPSHPRYLDTYRAADFREILQQINQELERRGLDPASTSEVCRLVLEETTAGENFKRWSEIRWVMNHHFRAANVTSEGLLNSISRGNTRLRKYDL